MGHRVGGSIAGAAGQTPAHLRDILSIFLDRLSLRQTVPVILGGCSAVMAIVLYKGLLGLSGRPRPEGPRYSRLRGEWRGEVLGAFRQLETELQRRAIFRRRKPSESFHDYVSAVEAAVGKLSSGDLRWLAGAASRAAYSDAGPDDDVGRLVAGHMRSSRGAIRLAEPIG
jgi:hypothetical protein